MVDSSTNEGQWSLVGRLIRSYREDDSHGGGPLSRGTLLYLISVHRGVESGKYDCNDLERWENGQGPIPREFLSDFCNALEIAPSELSRMKSLAGYGTEGEDQLPDPDQVLPLLRSLGKWVIPPSVYAFIGGLSLTLLQFDGPVVMMSYVLGLYAFLSGMFIWRWRRSAKMDELVGELLFITILAILSMGLVVGVPLRVDHYNFRSLPAFEALPTVFMVVILINILMAAVACLMFVLLRERLYTVHRARIGAYLRAVGTALPPILFAYVVAIPLNNPGGWIGNAVALGILFGAVTVILSCRDPDVTISDWERKWGSFMAVEIIAFLCIIGVVGMLVAYHAPSLTIASNSNNLLLPSEPNFAVLGYSESEHMERYRLGVIWMYLTIIVFLVSVVGSYLVTAIRRGRVESTVA